METEGIQHCLPASRPDRASAEGRGAGLAFKAVSSPVSKCLHETFPPAGIAQQEQKADCSTRGSFTLQELPIGNPCTCWHLRTAQGTPEPPRAIGVGKMLLRQAGPWGAKLSLQPAELPPSCGRKQPRPESPFGQTLEEIPLKIALKSQAQVFQWQLFSWSVAVAVVPAQLHSETRHFRFRC